MRDWRTIPLQYRTRSDVQPFPGLYPTRWKIRAGYSLDRQVRGAPKFTGMRSFKYLGRPNTNVANFVSYILMHGTVGCVRAWEFDRGGTQSLSECYLPYGNVYLPATHYTNGFRFYYPFDAGGYVITQWLRMMNRASTLWQGKRCVAYTSMSPDTILTNTWQEYKQWLDRAALQWGKPQSILTK